MRTRLRQHAVAAATLLPLLACAGALPTVGSIVKAPRALHSVRLSDSIARGDYWEVNIGAIGSTYRVYLPNTDLCRSFVSAKSAIEFSRAETFGVLYRQQLSCPLIGTASLPQWRDDNGGSRETNLKRVTARYELRYGDDDVLMARGHFPLAGLVGLIPNDIIAVAPASDACRSILARGEALMTYRSRGAPVFVLTVSGVQCDVIGMIIPQGR